MGTEYIVPGSPGIPSGNPDTPENILASPYGGWVFLISDSYYNMNEFDGILNNEYSVVIFCLGFRF